MANTSSAKKAIRKQSKQLVKNLRRKREYREFKKGVVDAIKQNNQTAAMDNLSKFTKSVDKAAKSNGHLHKNTAARYKSRLTHLVNAAFSA
jgi:small subunit ribosomal protein S20